MPIIYNSKHDDDRLDDMHYLWEIVLQFIENKKLDKHGFIKDRNYGEGDQLILANLCKNFVTTVGYWSDYDEDDPDYKKYLELKERFEE